MSLCYRVLAWILIGLMHCVAASSEEHSVSYESRVGACRYAFEVTGADIRNTPDWLPQNDNPPLSAREAMNAARGLMQKTFENHDEWTLDCVTLEPVSDDYSKWLYLIRYKHVEQVEQQISSSTIRVVVLMDGRAIQPTVTPLDG